MIIIPFSPHTLKRGGYVPQCIHCHFEIRVDNVCFNPMDYLIGNIKNSIGLDEPDFDANAYLPQNI